MFANVPLAPPDPILGIGAEFRADTAANKVNLAVGVYRGDDGMPYVLNAVKKADTSGDMEYAPISGYPEYVSAAQTIAFGPKCAALAAGRFASSQSLSGTGALRLAGSFLERFGSSKKIYLPNPTWGNHSAIFGDCGLELLRYPYYNTATKSLDFDALCTCLGGAEKGSVVVLHACAHNPTGLDPTREQWHRIFEIIKKQGLFPLVDMAYQGFASGNLDTDAFVPRTLADTVPNMILAQSFAKNFGLYGQRVGAIHVLCANKTEATCVESQIKQIIRSIYSSPPIYGARVVMSITKDERLLEEWKSELKGMADRMNHIRARLVEELKKCGSTKDWSHLLKQIGMMAFTGLSPEQVKTLKEQYHIYMTTDGRAAISGLNNHNVEYVAKAFHEVTKGK